MPNTFGHNLTNSEIEQKIVNEFKQFEWKSFRSFIRTVEDRNPFISGNIILILERCSNLSDELLKQISTCKEHLKSYQIDHLTYHWPLVNGKSQMPNSLIYKFLSYVHLSPDADCSAIQQLVLENEDHISKLLPTLSFYRNDNTHFVIPSIQQKLENSSGVFISWFPEEFRLKPKKKETIDIVVLANILLFLTTNNHTEIKGYAETINFMKSSVNSDLFVENIYRFTAYYPNLMLTLYLISRSIIWGNITELVELKDRIISISESYEKKTDMEFICYNSIQKLWGVTNIIDFDYKDDNSPFYYHAFTEGFHSLEFISRKPFIQMDFYSKALNLAMLRWAND